MAIIPVRCPSCDGDAVVKRGKTERGQQRYLGYSRNTLQIGT